MVYPIVYERNLHKIPKTNKDSNNMNSRPIIFKRSKSDKYNGDNSNKIKHNESRIDPNIRDFFEDQIRVETMWHWIPRYYNLMFLTRFIFFGITVVGLQTMPKLQTTLMLLAQGFF